VLHDLDLTDFWKDLAYAGKEHVDEKSFDELFSENEKDERLVGGSLRVDL